MEVSAESLVPPGEDRPLTIDGYAWSADRSLLLIYTNSKRVWRQNTRGDYWVLDRSSRQLRKLGGDAAASSLMFAKLSPTGRHVAYVRDRNIYVEDLLDRTIRPLTRTDSEHLINGTFDWVYEEELSLRDGFRWSPDGRSIAYWQLDTSGVPEFPLVNNTDSLYPQVKTFAYPKVGQTNSACRVGVVRLDGGETRWLDVPGDPRNHYIARMEWLNSDELVLQQLNRRQNTNRVMLAGAPTARSLRCCTNAMRPGSTFTTSCSGSKTLRRSPGSANATAGGTSIWSREPARLRLVTPGDYDVIELLHVDEQSHCIYFIASPDNPCQRYLYRVQLDGTGLTRITPQDEPGTHMADISPDGRWAILTSSSFDVPPIVDWSDCPNTRSFARWRRTRTSAHVSTS